MRVTFQKFFPWVWVAILLLLASDYWMLFRRFGGFAGTGLHIHLMQMMGWLMIALFVWLFQLTSEPFPVRGYKRIAVKVADVYGNESTVVQELSYLGVVGKEAGLFEDLLAR